MEGLSIFAERIKRETDRFSPILNGIGWVSFALITTDYAGFVDLPTLVSVPLWLGFVVACFRWAVWEGLIKPQMLPPANPPMDTQMVATRPQDTEEPSQN